MFVDISFPPSLSGFPKDSLYFLSASFINLYLAFNFPSNDLYLPRSLLFSVSCRCLFPCQLSLSTQLSLFLSAFPVPLNCPFSCQLSLSLNQLFCPCHPQRLSLQ